MRLNSSMAVELVLCTKLMKVGHSLRVLSLQHSSETINILFSENRKNSSTNCFLHVIDLVGSSGFKNRRARKATAETKLPTIDFHFGKLNRQATFFFSLLNSKQFSLKATNFNFHFARGLLPLLQARES